MKTLENICDDAPLPLLDPVCAELGQLGQVDAEVLRLLLVLRPHLLQVQEHVIAAPDKSKSLCNLFIKTKENYSVIFSEI